jgi:D-arabinose 1-dehydrogenase-like Zn-dependent alcohol dehydrogenase
MTTTMRAVQVSRPGGPFELVERAIPSPGPGAVLVKVEACGICHSDSAIKEGHLPVVFPRIPGHEVAGVIVALGEGVTSWAVGQRVGVGWNGGYCGTCGPCRRGELFACQKSQVTGWTYDGGYAEYMVAPASAVASIPDELSAVEAAPLMCAGITTFNALRNAGARPGDLVAILGLGGLGHLGVQFAAKMGFRTVAIARGPEKADLAIKLGAWRYLDSKASDVSAELRRLGGAKVVLATVTEGDAISAVQAGVGVNGSLIALAGVPRMTISTFPMFGRQSIRGWYSGTSIDSEDTMAFSARTGVRSMNEVFPSTASTPPTNACSAAAPASGWCSPRAPDSGLSSRRDAVLGRLRDLDLRLDADLRLGFLRGLAQQ